MLVDPDDVQVGKVLVLDWPPVSTVKHHGVVLLRFSRSMVRIAVSTGGRWDDYPEEYREEIDWSAPPHVQLVARWPRGAGVSYYYGCYVADVPSNLWLDVPGRATRKKTFEIADMFERWQRDILGF